MIDADESRLLRETFRGLLRSAAPADVAMRLRDEGWHDLAADEQEAAVGLLFEEQGKLRAATPALDLIVAAAVGVVLRPGDRIVHPPAILLAGESPLLLVVPGIDGPREVDASSVMLSSVRGFDPSMGVLTVSALGEQPRPQATAVAAARRALAHELIGLTMSMLELTVTQISERRQYGRLIGSFQTVQHRMADVEVALEGARAVTAASWRGDDSLVCDAAKALAGRAALLAAKHCQQVCGAIGFTAEHQLPSFVRRAHMIDALYGSSYSLQEQLGTAMLTAGRAFRVSPAWRSDY